MSKRGRPWMKGEFVMILADKIIELRKQNGWSQEELAEKMNVSRQSVSKWEGAQSVPDLDKILQLSQIFGVSTDYLLKDQYDADRQMPDVYQPESGRRIDLEEANEFIDQSIIASVKNAVAVVLCILSPALLIFLAGMFEESEIAAGIGVIVLLVMVAVAVMMFIMTGNQMSRYQYIEQEDIVLSYGVESMAEDKLKKGLGSYGIIQSIGVALCILSPVPLLAAAFANAGDAVLCGMVSLLLVIVAVAVFLFIVSSGERTACKKLLQQDDYTRKNKHINKKMEMVGSIYWSIATAIYLGWSFYTMDWHMTWIVWPVAGVLYAPVAAITRAVSGEYDAQ